MRDMLREAQKIDDPVGPGNCSGARQRRDRDLMMAYL